MVKAVVIILLLIIALAAFSGGQPNKAVVDGLRGKQDGCRTALDNYRSSGLIREARWSGSSLYVVVANERLWSQKLYDDKVRMALTAYCAWMPETGKLTVLVRGDRSNDVLGSVVDGDYMK